MILHLLRALFVLLMAAVGFFFVRQDPRPLAKLDVYVWLLPAIGLTVGVLLVCIDILSPRKKLAAFAGTFLGLIVGLCIAYALSFIVQWLVDQYGTSLSSEQQLRVVQFI